MKTEYIGVFQVPDGYFGDSAIVHLCFDPQTHCCLEVNDMGYFRSCAPPATTKEEAEWLIQNHPACKGRFEAAINNGIVHNAQEACRGRFKAATK